MEEGLLAAGTLSTGRELSDLPLVAITADSMAQVGLAALSLLLSSSRGQSSASSLPSLGLGASRPARLTQCPGGQPGSVPPAPPPGAIEASSAGPWGPCLLALLGDSTDCQVSEETGPQGLGRRCQAGPGQLGPLTPVSRALGGGLVVAGVQPSLFQEPAGLPPPQQTPQARSPRGPASRDL